MLLPGNAWARAAFIIALVIAAAQQPGIVRAADAPTTRNFGVGDMPQYGAWHSSRIGGGGYVQQVFPTHNPQVYYTYIDNSGLYRSDDAGMHWRMLHGTLPPTRGSYNVRGLSVDPRDENKLVIACGTRWDPSAGIFYSEDGGKSWHATNETKLLWFDGADGLRGAGPVFARQADQPDVILAATFWQGIWQSNDNGHTWKQLSDLSVRPTALYFDRTNAKHLWLCTGAQKSMSYLGKRVAATAALYESQDGGATWAKLTDGTCPVDFAQDPTDPQQLYGIFGVSHVEMSKDGGKTWNDFSDGLDVDVTKARATSGFYYLAITAGPDFVLVGSGNGTIYRLTPGQTKWEKVDRQQINAAGWFHGSSTFGWAMSSLTVDPRDPKHWLMTDFHSIFQSFDAGQHWQLTIDGIELTVIHDLVQDPTDPAVVYCAMADNCFFESHDGGKNFSRFRKQKVTDWSNIIDAQAISAKQVDLSPKDPDRIYVLAGVGATQVITQLYCSTDRGYHFTKSPMTGIEPKSETRNSMAVSPDDPMSVYIAQGGRISEGKGGVYHSKDGGKNWQWISKGLPYQPYVFFLDPWNQGNEIAVGPGEKVVCISKFSPGMWSYKADTDQWTKANTKFGASGGQPYCVSADFLKLGRFFVGVNHDGVYRSDDAGATWKRVYNHSAAYVATDRAKPNRVAAATDDGVVLSTDGGDTWTMLDKNLPDRVLRNPLAFAGERLLAGSAGSGVFWIALSPEGEKDVTMKPESTTSAR